MADDRRLMMASAGASGGIKVKRYQFVASGSMSNNFNVDIDTSKVHFIHFWDEDAVYTTQNTTYEGFRIGPACTFLSAVAENPSYCNWRTNSAGTTTGFTTYGLYTPFQDGKIYINANPALTSGHTIAVDVYYE